RTETRLRLRLGLEEVLDLLIDRDAAGPAGGRIGPYLDVARRQLGGGEETGHAAHVAVTIALDLVIDALQEQCLVAEWREWFEDRFELEFLAGGVRPELLLNRAIG